MPRSPSSSPIRKRARLSSPTYDDGMPDLTQEEMDALEAIDVQLSQNIRPQPAPSFQRASVLENDGWDSSQPQPTPTPGGAGFSFVKASNLDDDPDNPFSTGFSSASKLPTANPKPTGFATAGFASASMLPLVQDTERSPSPEVPPEEPDYDAWFQPAAAVDIPVAFQAPLFSTGAAALMGFTKASNKGVIKPSAKALALAKAKEDAWNREEEERLRGEAENASALEPPEAVKMPIIAPMSMSTAGFQLASKNLLAATATESPRTVLGPASNILNTPSTPSPAGFSRPSLGRPAASQASPANSNNNSNSNSNSIYRPKQFKPPTFRQPAVGNASSSFMTPSPLNPRRLNAPSGFAPASSQGQSSMTTMTTTAHPLAAPPITRTHQPSTSTSTSAPISMSMSTSTPARFNIPAPITCTSGITTGNANANPFTTPLRAKLPSSATMTTNMNTNMSMSMNANTNMSMTMNRRSTPAPFKTPFKPGMGPSEPGRMALNAKLAAASASAGAGVGASLRASPAVGLSSRNVNVNTPVRPVSTDRQERAKGKKTFFNTKRDGPRQTLADSGLRPQRYDALELEERGVPVEMLRQITPETAMYYAFHAQPSSTSSSSSSSSSTSTSTSTSTSSSSNTPETVTPQPTSLGPAEALQALLDRGCALATKPWVDNHWALVLWKLAGMVALEAGESLSSQSQFQGESKGKGDDKGKDKDKGEGQGKGNARAERWCWAEVIRQLLYRYERELHAGARPPLRRIVNQDTPAACPLVLCVSGVFWSPPTVNEEGEPVPPHPELEVTDGWYRLRAKVDLPLARAVRRGVVRVGRKIGVAGARLETEKKEPMEILEAYSSNKLCISGNSSHLMPWHAKLGWMEGPCISTLHSLTADGGLVTAMDLVITKVYPVAYIEFIEEEDGTKGRIGPRNEAEEMQVHEQWKRKYQMEAAKLREAHEKKIARYEAYVDRLERKASSSSSSSSSAHFKPAEAEAEDDDPPSHIDAYFDELEYADSAAARLASISARDAGWLALHIRRETARMRERLGEEVEREMAASGVCAPRNVRSFRVLVVRDARAERRGRNRVAQVNVWDVAGMGMGEDEGGYGGGAGGGGGGGGFKEGQRYLVTNLVPQQMSAWMDCAPGSEVYLCTRKDSRWTRIRGVPQ